MARGGLQGCRQSGSAGCAAALGHPVGGHEGIAGAGDPGFQHRRRRLADHAIGGAAGRGPRSIGDQYAMRTAPDQSGGRRGRIVEAVLAQDPGFLQVEVERGACAPEQRQQALGLAGTGWSDSQIGPRKQRRMRDLCQQRLGQVSIQRHRPGPGTVDAAQAAVAHRPQDLLARSFQRIGVSHRRDQPVGGLDGEVAVRRQILRTVQVRAIQPHAFGHRDQFLAVIVAADCREAPAAARSAPASWRCSSPPRRACA